MRPRTWDSHHITYTLYTHLYTHLCSRTHTYVHPVYMYIQPYIQPYIHLPRLSPPINDQSGLLDNLGGAKGEEKEGGKRGEDTLCVMLCGAVWCCVVL